MNLSMPSSVVSDGLATPSCCSRVLCCRRVPSRFRKSVEPVINSLTDLEESERLILSGLLLDQTETSFAMASWNRTQAMWLNSITLVGSTLVSAGIAIQEVSGIKGTGWDVGVFWTLMFVSLTVTLAANFQQLFNFVEVSKVYDETATKINAMTWNFFALTDEFEGMSHHNAVRLFIKNVSKLKETEANSLRAALNKGRQTVIEAPKNGNPSTAPAAIRDTPPSGSSGTNFAATATSALVSGAMDAVESRLAGAAAAMTQPPAPDSAVVSVRAKS